MHQGQLRPTSGPSRDHPNEPPSCRGRRARITQTGRALGPGFEVRRQGPSGGKVRLNGSLLFTGPPLSAWWTVGSAARRQADYAARMGTQHTTQPALSKSLPVAVTGVVLAAGAGRRYGMAKALIAYPDRLLVQRAADTLQAAGCARTVVVLGAEAARVRVAAPDLPETVVNADWASGLGSSLRVGLKAALDTAALDTAALGTAALGTAAVAAVVLLVDMPGVTVEAVRRIVAYARPDALVQGGYGDRRGHPVLLGRDHWAGVIDTASGDNGARDYLRAHADLVTVVAVGDVADDQDLDFRELNPYA